MNSKSTTTTLVTPSDPVATDRVPTEPSIIFFDGVCGLCNRFVDFVLPRDRRKRFLFSPLQGETAAARLDRADTERITSVVLLQDQKSYRKTAAVTRVLWGLGGVWAIFGGLLWIIPGPIRDVGYAPVAKLRYRLFGKKESCRLPTPEERARFLP